MARHLPTLPTVVAAVALAALGAAPIARADSIAYVKDGDVWLATPDGARQQRVTTSKDISYVSVADDGTMVALVPGERLRKLSPTGRTLAEYPTYVSDGAAQSGPVNQFAGPFNPEISPDGKLVAFEWFNTSYDNGTSPDCSATGSPPCYVLTSREGVGITRSDAFSGFEEYGLMTGWIGPQWLGNDRLLRSDAGTAWNEDAVFTGVKPGGADKDLDRWFWDNHQAYGLKEVRLTRDHKAAAAIAGDYDDRVRVYRPVVEPFGAPDQDLGPFAETGSETIVEPCFELSGPVGGSYESLSFSPDGRSLAYGVGDGIWTVDVPDFSGGCQIAKATKLVIPGGRFPHWGPADVPPASAFEAPKTDAPKTDVPVPSTLSASGRPSTARRLVVDLTSTTAGTARLTARRDGRLVAKATRKVAAGRTRVVLKPGKAGRRTLRRGGTVRVTVALGARKVTVKLRIGGRS